MYMMVWFECINKIIRPFLPFSCSYREIGQTGIGTEREEEKDKKRKEGVDDEPSSNVDDPSNPIFPDSNYILLSDKLSRRRIIVIVIVIVKKKEC
jgi:hypothetical protein